MRKCTKTYVYTNLSLSSFYLLLLSPPSTSYPFIFPLPTPFPSSFTQLIFRQVRRASEVHRQTRKYANEFIKPGMTMIEICDRMENTIRKLVEESGLSAGKSFPTFLFPLLPPSSPFFFPYCMLYNSFSFTSHKIGHYKVSSCSSPPSPPPPLISQ